MRVLARGALESLRRPRAVALVWLARLLVAWIVASPLARTLTAQGTTDLPRGDAVLFDPGGLWLVEALRLGWPVLRSELRGTLLVGGVLAWLSLIPLAVLLVALASPYRTPVASAGSRAIALFPRLTLLFGATLLLQGAVIGGAVFAALELQERWGTSWDERSSDLCALGVLALGLVLALAIGILQDLARAALIDDDGGAIRATRRALGLGKRNLGVALGAWVGSSALAVLTVLVAGACVGWIDVSRPGEWRVVLVTIVHQLAVLAMVFFRATWLSVALDLLRRAPRVTADRSEGSGEPVGPSPHPIA